MVLTSYASGIGYRDPDRTNFWGRLEKACSSQRAADVLFLAFIFIFGAFQFFSIQRVHDFQRDDVFYADAGRSLVEHGFYGINGHPETNQPPGLPFLLGLLSWAGMGSHLVFLRVMVVFETLGFFVTYELLRRQLPRIVAALICLLLISSPIFFLLASRWVFPSFPYLFTSMSALLVARKFESSTGVAQRVAWGALLTALIAASLMFASAAMAFLGAILASTGVLLIRNPQLAWERVKIYSAVFLISLAIQAGWMHRKPSPLEWPIPGYPQSYLAQLKVKSGNYPELGMASPADLPARVLRNASDDSILLSQTLLRHWVDVAWMSLLVTGPIALILLGLVSSSLRSEGGLQEWYFVGYQFIYLLWPWKLEPRFFLPVFPLACFYMWRGGEALLFLAKHKPRLLGVATYPVAVILAVSSWFWMHGSWFASHMTHAGLQDETSFAVWVLSAILAVRMLWEETSWQRAATAIQSWFSQPFRFPRISPLRLVQLLGGLAVLVLSFIGLASQIDSARANLRPISQANSQLPDVLAAEWINSHTDSNAIVMARHVPIVFHYAARKIVWFPPSSNPQLLMEGIQKHKIDFVIVVTRDNSYYLPPEEDCMAALLPAYPNEFDLAYQSAGFKIYRTLKNRATSQLKSSGPLQ
jgi:hypothetical protein